MIPALLFALLLQTPRDGAVPQSGTAAIGGVVFNASDPSHAPLRRALVSINGTTIIARQVATDDQGHFLFPDLPAGRFTLTVEKGGYLKTYVGSRRPGHPPSLPIAVVAGQRVLDLAVDVAHGAAIEGVVRDELGAPIPTSQVSVMQRLVVASDARFVSVPNVSRAVADDRGHYRIYGLAPGDYIVQATGATNSAVGSGAELPTDDEFRAAEALLRQTGVMPTAPAPKPAATQAFTRSLAYAPGAADIRAAQVISVGLGDERLGVDVSSPLVIAAKLDLRVSGPSGGVPEVLGIGISSVTRQSLFTSPGMVRPGADGHVLLPGMAPGTYLFWGSAREPGPNGKSVPLFVKTEVTVNGVDIPVSLDFQRGPAVSGKLSAAVPLPVMPGARVSLVAEGELTGVQMGANEAAVEPDGSFSFAGVPPGRYRVGFSGVGGWQMQTATLDGRDVLDTPLEVRQGTDVTALTAIISNRLTEISGVITDAAGRPSPEYTALVIPANRALWLTAPRRTSGLVKIGSDGRYRVEGLPPGDYLLAVIVDADPTQLFDPGFLEQVAAGAIPFTLAEAQKLVQDLKIGG